MHLKSKCAIAFMMLRNVTQIPNQLTTKIVYVNGDSAKNYEPNIIKDNTVTFLEKLEVIPRENAPYKIKSEFISNIQL